MPPLHPQLRQRVLDREQRRLGHGGLLQSRGGRLGRRSGSAARADRSRGCGRGTRSQQSSSAERNIGSTADTAPRPMSTYCGALAREHERTIGRPRAASPAISAAGRALAAQPRRLGVVGRSRDEHAPVRESLAAGLEGEGHVGEVELGMLVEMAAPDSRWPRRARLRIAPTGAAADRAGTARGLPSAAPLRAPRARWCRRRRTSSRRRGAAAVGRSTDCSRR